MLRGVSLATVGPARGHGFELDQTSIEQIAGLVGEGVKGRWSHSGEIGSHLGWHREGRVEGEQARADFHFSALASKARPVGLDVDAKSYLLDAAENDPEAVALSVDIDYDLELESVPEGEDRRPRAFVRVRKLRAVDFVGEPAANPAGMFSEGPQTPTKPAQEGDSMKTQTAENDAQTAKLAEIQAKHAAELAARDAKLEALATKLAALEQAETERLTRTRAGYVAELERQCVALQQPLSAEQVERVRKIQAQGLDDVAEEIGAAYLAAAQAKHDRDNAGRSQGGGTLIAANDESKANVEAGIAALLDAAKPMLKGGE